MRYLILILLIACSFIAKAQVPSGSPTVNAPTGYYKIRDIKAVRTFGIPVSDTTYTPAYDAQIVKRPQDGFLYYYDSSASPLWRLIASQGSSVSSANNGLSLSSTTVQLGQLRSGGGSAAALLNSREIPMSDSSIYFTNGLFNITADHQVSGALPILNVQSTSVGFHEMAQFKGAGAVEVHARTTSSTGYASFLTSINGSLKLTIGSDGNATHNFIQLKNGYDIYIEDDASSPFAVFGANDNISLGVNGTTRYTGVGVSSPAYKLDIANAKTVATTDDRILNLSDAGTTYNTSGGARVNYGAFLRTSATQTVGSNGLTNITLNLRAINGQTNQALVVDTGDVVVGVVSDADTYMNVAHAQTVNNGSSTQRHGELQVTRSMVFNDTLSGTENFSAVQRIASRFRAKQSYTIADELHGSPLEAQYNLLRNTAYTGAVTYQGAVLPMNNVTTMPSVLVARMNMSTVQSGANSVRATGWWAGVTSAVYLNTGNRINNFAWFNGGAGQWTDGAIDSGYIFYANALPSLVGVKYAIKQVGTADSNSFAGVTRHPNLAVQTDTMAYKPMVVSANGTVSRLNAWPASSISATDVNAWHKTGDAFGANSSFGTTDAFNIAMLANNVEKGKIFSTGKFNWYDTVALGTTGTAGRLRFLRSADGSLGFQQLMSTNDMIMNNIAGTTQIQANGTLGLHVNTSGNVTVMGNNSESYGLKVNNGLKVDETFIALGSLLQFASTGNLTLRLLCNSSTRWDLTNTSNTVMFNPITSNTGAWQVADINGASGIILGITTNTRNISMSGSLNMQVTTSSAGTLTIGTSIGYVFTGTTTTWTLPAVSGTSGRMYFIKNRGSGNITLNSNSGSEIYDTAAQTGITILPGASIILMSDGTYFTVN